MTFKSLKLIPSLSHDKNGAVAVIVALSMPVLLGGMAFALDLANYRVERGRLQSAADAAALAAIANLDDFGRTRQVAIQYASNNVPANYGRVTTAEDVETGIYTSSSGFTPSTNPADVNAVRVRTIRSPERGNPGTRFFPWIWGPDSVRISAVAIAARQLNVQYEPPEKLNMPYDAGDLNEIYAYCFNYLDTGKPADKRREQMTLVAQNLNYKNVKEGLITKARAKAAEQALTKGREGTNAYNTEYNKVLTDLTADINRRYPDGGTMTDEMVSEWSNGKIPKIASSSAEWPECTKRGESLSFRIRNIRHAKSFPQLWDLADGATMKADGYTFGRPEHNYFSDTSIKDGVETYNYGVNIQKNKLCSSEKECTSISTAEGKQLGPETRPCEPGKFMYFGWEDRPPMNGSTSSGSWLQPNWTDRDYDDIRFTLKCPKYGRLGDGKTRLVG